MILNARAVISEFRKSRGQIEEKPINEVPTKKRTTNSASFYDNFLKKYNDLENSIDNLGTRDLVYYFREVAEEQGYKYVVSNIKKDMAIMKRLKANYENREICGMIEFLYESDQNYLDKNRLSPNILASQWVNTIYADMKLWVEDLYVPKDRQAKKKKSISNREWDNKVAQTKDNVNIGIEL